MRGVVHAACPHDCPDACGVLITIEDGKAVRIQGDPAHPVTRGFLCAKVAKYLERVYSPDRILYPMRRVGPKGTSGPDTFARISWEQALDEIAARFRQIATEFGGEAILPYSYGGTLAVLNGGSMDRRFFHRLGASRLERTICSDAGEAGLKSVVGVKLGTEPEQFAQARLIIAWGANIHGNNIHLWPFIEEARRKGARLVVIDPYRTRTAACADWYLPIHPGTDVALALAMLHVIIGEELYDADYVARYTLGFDALRAKVREYTPEKAANWTGITADDIRRLAREYAGTRPAAIRLNYGIQRCENGGMATRAITMLPTITGSWKEVGGGLQLSTSGAFKLKRSALERPDLEARTGSGDRPPRSINMIELGRELNERRDPPLKALYVYNANPAAVCPDHNAVVRGLMRADLFAVAHEQFFTDTCDYADLVLPATTFFEHRDLQTSYGHYYLQLSEQAIEPLGECRSNVETFRALAERMGFDEPCFRESVDEMIDLALGAEDSMCSAISRERLQAEKHVRLPFIPLANSGAEGEAFLPFAKGHFPTPSGKAELFSAELAAQGLDPVATFTPPVESRHGAAIGHRYPLEFLARKTDNFLNSTFCNLAGLQALEDSNRLDLHPADAAVRGVRDKEWVRVFNDRGSIRLRARVTADGESKVRAGVVAGALNWAKLAPGGQVNELTSDRLTDMGGAATFYSVLVEVAKE